MIKEIISAITNLFIKLLYAPFGRTYSSKDGITTIGHGKISGIDLNPGDSIEFGDNKFSVDEKGNVTQEYPA